jgi:uncharacterized repeat protein (TIGR03847 family)
MSASFDFDAPDHFTVGAVGQPGKRTFYLQGRQAETLVTLKCEKEQVGALAEYVAGLLVRLKTMDRPAVKDMPLLEPIESIWDVGAVGVGYDEQADRILVVANEAIEEAETAEETAAESAVPTEPVESAAEEGATARFALTRRQAADFVERARAVMKAGRPTCPMCGSALEPGHLCPRANGHVKR